MSAADNKKLVQDAFAAWARGDGTAFFNLLADDVQWTVIGSSPVSRTYPSKQAFLRRCDQTTRAKLAGPIQPTVKNIIAEGDNIVLQWEGKADYQIRQTVQQQLLLGDEDRQWQGERRHGIY